MKNQVRLLTIFSHAMLHFLLISSILAGPVERSGAEAARKAVNDLRITAATTKAQLDITTKDLAAQRLDLQQKIRTLRKDYRTNTTNLKSSSKKSIDALHNALKKYKETAITAEEGRDADSQITQSAADEIALNQAVSQIDQITLPKEIFD